MPRILSFGENSSSGKPDNIFYRVWQNLQSMDKFGKSIVVISILITISTPFIVANNLIFNPKAAGNTFVVGPSEQYTTIQSAVVAATNGDIIQVKAGIYNEQVSVGKGITIQGEQGSIIDGECNRTHGIWAWGDGLTVRGMEIRNTVEGAVFLNANQSGQTTPTNITIDGNYIHDFDCNYAGQDPSSYGQYNAGIVSWYGGSNINITNNNIVHRAAATTHNGRVGASNGIWFKSNDSNPSGGGHLIANNVIIGGWDGIGGEEEGSAHGTFDKNTIVEKNIVRDCWDDGIQSEGGDENVILRENDVSGCGTGIAFAAPITGPLTVERNYIHDLSLGLYDNRFCFKAGNSSTATVYLTENVCKPGPGGADGIMQTNAGMFKIIARRNCYETSRYIFHITEPSGSDFDEDTMYTTDTSRFVKWTGGTLYTSLSAFQDGTNNPKQEVNGKIGQCSSITPTPTPVSLPTATPTRTPTPIPSSGNNTLNVNSSPATGVAITDAYSIGMNGITNYSKVLASTMITRIDAPSSYTNGGVTYTFSSVSGCRNSSGPDNYDRFCDVYVTGGATQNVIFTYISSPTATPTKTPTPTPIIVDNIRPTVSIIYPPNNSILKRGSTITITASATDNTGIKKVEFYLDGNLICADYSSSYSCEWKIPGKPDTSYLIKVIAYDLFDNQASAQSVVTSSPRRFLFF